MALRPRHVRPLHIALASLVVAVWGTNFVVIKVGLRDFPPFLFATLRFIVSAFPFVFFIRRPRVEWRWLAIFGVLLGAGQFGLMFYAMRADISPGLASLVVQMQVFFTIGLSMWLFGERATAAHVVGTLLAAAGLGVIGLHLDASGSLAGVLMVVTAGFFWACANVVIKMAARRSSEPIDMVGFIVWSSLFAIPPLLAMTLAFEGWEGDRQAITQAHAAGWAALAWQSIGNMIFGYAAWNWLLTRYDAAVITPYALLIPVFGMGSSALLLGEALPAWKLVATAMVLGGITLITLMGRRRRA